MLYSMFYNERTSDHFICCNTQARAKAKPSHTRSKRRASSNCTHIETEDRIKIKKGLSCVYELSGDGRKGLQGGDGSERVASTIEGSETTFSVVVLVKYRTERQLTTESNRQRFVMWRKQQMKTR